VDPTKKTILKTNQDETIIQPFGMRPWATGSCSHSRTRQPKIRCRTLAAASYRPIRKIRRYHLQIEYRLP